jgi:hypothetical protein
MKKKSEIVLSEIKRKKKKGKYNKKVDSPPLN